MEEWPFDGPPNVATFTSKGVVEDGEWIHYVAHDDDDGAWQFHSIRGAPTSDDDARVVSLGRIVELDPSILLVADLPAGWWAWRDTKDSQWQRRASI